MDTATASSWTSYSERRWQHDPESKRSRSPTCGHGSRSAACPSHGRTSPSSSRDRDERPAFLTRPALHDQPSEAQHRFIRQFALASDSDVSTIIRLLLSRIEADPVFAEEIHSMLDEAK